MTLGSKGLNTLAIIAILSLLGLSLFVYAVPGAEGAPLAGDNSGNSPNTSQSNSVYFHLLPVSPAAKEANASGYAGISVSGTSASLEWSISGGTPGEQLMMLMSAVDSSGASHALTVAPVTVSSDGTAGGSAKTTLDSGQYAVSLKVVQPSTATDTIVFISDPSTAQMTVGQSQPTPPPPAIGNSLSFALVPLPVYEHQLAPSNYSFREGGALVVVSGDVLTVTVSFLGAPDTGFVSVVQTDQRNITIGAATTTSTGGGVFKGNVTLSPGAYQIGLLLFVSGKTDAPVAVSVPRAIQLTLLSPGTTSTTTSSSTKSSSELLKSSESTSTSTSSSTTAPPSSQAVNHFVFAPITTSVVRAGYRFGEGTGGYMVSGGNLYFSLAFTGQNPDTSYSLVLLINGSARTIGNYTTNDGGEGNLGASTQLGTGSFVLGLTVVDLSSFSQPTPVLASVPSSFTVSAHARTTTTTTVTSNSTSSTSSTGLGLVGNTWAFKLVPSTVENVPSGYRFAASGTAVVFLEPEYSLLNVVIGFQDGNPSTTYKAALVLNGTTENLGTMTTGKSGNALLHSSVQVDPGTYFLGIAVFDVSDIAAFQAASSVQVLVTSPSTQLVVIGPPSGGSSSSSTTSSSASTTSQSAFSTVTEAATTISAGTVVQAQIQSAVNNLTIPATVQVTPLESSTTVLDPRFSLSVGQQVGNGLVIAISGENVTGPRVLLINMSRTSPLSLYPALNVTLDGAPVAEASSALQVLNPISSNPPFYVLVATSDSIQLLISIPHFSLHLIQVAGVIVHAVVTSLELDAPLLIGSIAVVSLAFAAAYAARKRYFSVLI